MSQMHKYCMGAASWVDYVKSCYDLVIESEGIAQTMLNEDTESYVVHLMARNFERTDIGSQPVALTMMAAVNSHNTQQLLAVADECLLIHSFPMRRHRWPSNTYYHDMGTTAYGLAAHAMEQHFGAAALIIHAIFNRTAGI